MAAQRPSGPKIVVANLVMLASILTAGYVVIRGLWLLLTMSLRDILGILAFLAIVAAIFGIISWAGNVLDAVKKADLPPSPEGEGDPS